MKTILITNKIKVHLFDAGFDYFFTIGSDSFFSSEYIYNLEIVKTEMADIGDWEVSEITDRDVQIGILTEHLSKTLQAKYPQLLTDQFWDLLYSPRLLCA